jgi:hypothetical protein
MEPNCLLQYKKIPPLGPIQNQPNPVLATEIDLLGLF